MTAPQRRTLVPERLLLPPAPNDPVARERWHSLDFPTRRRLALTMAGAVDVAPQDEPVVRALAARRLATGWRLYLAAGVLGWLVLMTVWGFGRSTYPAVEGRYLAAGLLLGGVAAAVAIRDARRRLRRIAARWPRAAS